MSAARDDGGPAFHPMHDPNTHVFGMTLRDYIAAHASEDDVNAHVWKGHTEDYVVNSAGGQKTVLQRQASWTREEAKYRYADAMLAARSAT